MLKLIVGSKGSGKTKTLIQNVNNAARDSKGNVVCIEYGKKLTYDLVYSIKLTDITDYGIKGYNELYGFLAGIASGNYDVTHIFMDGLFKVCERNYTDLIAFFNKITKIPGEIQYMFTVSEDISNLPEDIKKFID